MSDLNDALGALFEGDTGPTEPRITTARPIPVYKTAVERFEEGCPKCGGSGKFISWSGRDVGPCFACKGEGKRSFKTSSETRAANRDKSAMKKAQTISAWREDCKAELAWLEAATAKQYAGRQINWDFPVKLSESLAQFGTLTDGQIGAIRKCMARDVAWATERAQKAAEAPAVEQAGIDRLKASFDQAVAYSAAKGLKLSPRITIDGLTISPAKANSANPGALYVKSGQDYLGKVTNGRFHASRECTKENETKVLAFIADPAEAAKVYGQTTGTCCVCNATLRSEWKHKGIGPICAEKFGWS